jgi:hypothetical protein
MALHVTAWWRWFATTHLIISSMGKTQTKYLKSSAHHRKNNSHCEFSTIPDKNYWDDPSMNIYWYPPAILQDALCCDLSSFTFRYESFFIEVYSINYWTFSFPLSMQETMNDTIRMGSEINFITSLLQVNKIHIALCFNRGFG